MSEKESKVAFRRIFFKTWAKHRAKLPLDQFEQQMVFVIQQYPEYHEMLSNPDQFLQKEYPPTSLDSNPFLRMGIHMSLVEQLHLDQPQGIREIYNALSTQLGNPALAEQHMIVSLANTLWAAQAEGRFPTDEEYLADLKDLCSSQSFRQ